MRNALSYGSAIFMAKLSRIVNQPILRGFFEPLLDGNVLGRVSDGSVLLGLQLGHLHLRVPGLVL